MGNPVRALLLAMAFAMAPLATAQVPTTSLDARPGAYRAAVVALVADSKFRVQLEDSLVAKGSAHGFDLVPSHQLVFDVREFSGDKVPAVLGKQGVSVVVMVRPASVGEGVSLEAVRDSLPPALYSRMRQFAAQSSPDDASDLIAVVHVAIYSLATAEPRLVTAGAVWLNEPVASREEGISRLEDMLLQNVEAARAQIRSHLDDAAGR